MSTVFFESTLPAYPCFTQRETHVVARPTGDRGEWWSAPCGARVPVTGDIDEQGRPAELHEARPTCPACKAWLARAERTATR